MIEEELDFELQDIEEMFKCNNNNVLVDNRVGIFENSNELKKINKKHTRKMEK
jgi:hypothetical protein